MADARRKRPWWHWALGAFAGLLILSALFGADDKKPAKAAATTTTAGTPHDQPGAPPPPRPSRERVRQPMTAGRRRGLTRDRCRCERARRDQKPHRKPDRAAGGRRGAVRRPRRLAPARAGRPLPDDQAHPDRAIQLHRREGARRRTRAARTAAAAQRRRDASCCRAAKRRAAREQAASACDPSYAGAGLSRSADYDCEGGSGNGPDYTGTVQVVGDDHFDLDRDGDGTGCESRSADATPSGVSPHRLAFFARIRQGQLAQGGTLRCRHASPRQAGRAGAWHGSPRDAPARPRGRVRRPAPAM